MFIQIIISIVCPGIVAFFNHFLTQLREKGLNYTKAEMKLKYCYKFMNPDQFNYGSFEKDQLAKIISDQKNATYEEVKYFLKYKNAEHWMTLFFLYKKEIFVVRDHSDSIAYIFSRYTLKKYIKLLAGYSLCCFLGTFTVLMALESLLRNENLIIYTFVLLLSLVLVIFAIALLNHGEKLRDSSKFIKNFRSNAIKI